MRGVALRVPVAVALCALAVAGCQAQEVPVSAALPEAGAVREALSRACAWGLQDAEPQEGGRDNNGWVRATLYAGVLAAHRATGDQQFLDGALRWARATGFQPRGGRQLGRRDSWADNLCCGQSYVELSLLKGDPKMLDGTRAALQTLLGKPESGRDEWWWCDSLFMAPATMTLMAQATGDRRYLDEMDRMWWETYEYLYDKDEHLYFRDSGYFRKRTPHGQKVFWGRGNGWVIGGLCRVIEHFPVDDPRRGRYEDLLREMAAKLLTLQQSDGLWRPSLLDPLQVPIRETSGSGFFCFGLAWGINHGVLDRATYLPAVAKAWNGLVGCVDPVGKLGYVQPVGAAPAGVKPDGNFEYGTGALLLAGEQVLKLAQGTAG